jgi:hypothetical protein
MRRLAIQPESEKLTGNALDEVARQKTSLMKKSNKPKPVKKARAQTNSAETIGIELGDKTSCYCILNAEGEVIERASFHNAESSVEEAFRIADGNAHRDGTRNVIGLDQPFSEKRWPRSASGARAWTCRASAAVTARMTATTPRNWLAERAWTRSCSIRWSTATNNGKTDLSAISARDAMVRARTLLVNNPRGLAKTQGARLPAAITVNVWIARLGSLEGRHAIRAQAAAGAGRSARPADCGLRRDAGKNRRPTVSGRDQSAVLGARGGDTDLVDVCVDSVGRAAVRP